MLASLLTRDAFGGSSAAAPTFANFAPNAKRIIYLFMSGGPLHLDLFDYKPTLGKMHCEDPPPYRPEEINHHAAMAFFQTGPQIAGRPSPGAWISYDPGFDGR